MIKIKKHNVFILAILLAFLFYGPALAQQNVTVVGTVVGSYQIEDENGEIYEIDDNEKGEELNELYDSKVSVTGTLMDEDGSKILTVDSFKIIEE